jgi:dihydrofolate reductase
VGRLIYTGIASLDGFTEDAEGRFDWSAPDEEVHRFVNDLERPVATYLLGRRMYETLVYWEGEDTSRGAVERDYAAIWQAADKVVYSRTLTEPASARTRIERELDPAAVRGLKEASERDLSIGGPELAAHAIAAGLVDEYVLLVNPVIVGGGKPYLPAGVRLDLELLDQRRFANGVVFLRYAAAT